MAQKSIFCRGIERQKEVLWRESKLRLKALVNDAVNVLTKGIRSSDEKVAITSAVHIQKAVGLYGEGKSDFGPTTPERAVWDQRAEKELQIYMALRPDSFCDYSVKRHMEELAQEDVHKNMKLWYEIAVDEQKKELREYRKKLKTQETQLPRIELIPALEKENTSQGQESGLEPEEV